MLLDEYHKNLPDYYPYMYLDGYTPEQIMEAMHRTVRKEWEANRQAKREQAATVAAIQAQIEKELEKTVSKALDDIFKGWK